MSKKRKNPLRRMMPGVHPAKPSHEQTGIHKAKHPKQSKAPAKVKPEAVAATLIAKLYRLKDERVVSLLGKFGPDRLSILAFLMKYGVEPPASLLRLCTAQAASKVSDVADDNAKSGANHA